MKIKSLERKFNKLNHSIFMYLSKDAERLKQCKWSSTMPEAIISNTRNLNKKDNKNKKNDRGQDIKIP